MFTLVSFQVLMCCTLLLVSVENKQLVDYLTNKQFLKVFILGYLLSTMVLIADVDL